MVAAILMLFCLVFARPFCGTAAAFEVLFAMISSFLTIPPARRSSRKEY